MKKVLHLQTGGGVSGGISNYISILVRNHVAIESYVTCSTSKADTEFFSDKYNNSKLIDFPETYNCKTFSKELIALVRFLSMNKIDVIHAHALRAGFLGACCTIFKKSRLVYTNHGIRYSQKKNMISKVIFYITELLVVLRASKVVCIRPYDYNNLRKDMPFFWYKFECIQTRYDLEVSSIDVESKLPFCLVGIGSLIQIKNPLRFIEAVCRLNSIDKRFHGIWIGDGNLIDSMKEIVKNKKIDIAFVGHVAEIDVLAYLKRALFLIISSDVETLPMVAIESYAMGVPILCNNFPGVEDFIDNGVTGIVYNNNLIDADIEIINCILKDYTFFANNSQNHYNKNFMGVGIMVEAYQRVYDGT